MHGIKMKANRRVDATTYICHRRIQKLERFLEIDTVKQIQKIRASKVPYKNNIVNPMVCFSFSPAYRGKKTDFS